MQPIIQNKTFIQTAPRTRLNSIEQTTTLEAQNLSEHASYAYERPINFSEFIQA